METDSFWGKPCLNYGPAFKWIAFWMPQSSSAWYDTWCRHDVQDLLTKAIASLLCLPIYPSHNPSLSVLPCICLFKREHSVRVPAGGSLRLIYNCSAAEMFSERCSPSCHCLSSFLSPSDRCFNGPDWILPGVTSQLTYIYILTGLTVKNTLKK